MVSVDDKDHDLAGTLRDQPIPSDPPARLRHSIQIHHPRAVDAAGGMTQGAVSSVSTPQRTHAWTVVVDRETADVLRLQAKTVMDLGHELFEDFLLYGPEAQYALAMRFCAATALITAVGWDPNNVNPNTTTFEVPLTDDLIEQLRRRRWDLAVTNKDRLDGLRRQRPHRPRPPRRNHRRPPRRPSPRPPLRQVHNRPQHLNNRTIPGRPALQSAAHSDPEHARNTQPRTVIRPRTSDTPPSAHRNHRPQHKPYAQPALPQLAATTGVGASRLSATVSPQPPPTSARAVEHPRS